MPDRATPLLLRAFLVFTACTAPQLAVAQTGPVPSEASMLAYGAHSGGAAASSTAAAISPRTEATLTPSREVSAGPEPQTEHDDQGDDVTVEAELGSGVTIAVGDAFSLQTRARIQFQAALSRPTDEAIAQGAEDGTSVDFLIRRMRIALSGHVLDPTLRYYIQFGFAPRDLELDLPIPVRDAAITWTPHPWFGIRFGQMKVPYGMQRVVSSSALQFVDRSSVVAELNIDRDVGVVVLSEDLFSLDGLLQYQLGVFGGRGRNRMGGVDAAMFAGRVQLNPFGSFDVLSEADLTRSSAPRLAVGASAAYNANSNRARSTHGQTLEFADFDYLHLGGDIHFKWAGFSLLSEVMYRAADRGSVTETIDGNERTEYSRSAWGWFAQAGYVLPFPLELSGRYGEIRPLSSDPSSAISLQREVGGAVSYYVSGHALKIQADYFYLWGANERGDRHQVRVQAQLFF